MSWEVLTTEDVLSEFTLREADAIRILQGSGSGSGSGLPFANMDVIVAHVIDEVRGYIIAGGYEVDLVLDTTIPISLFEDAIAIARWRLLIATPSFRQLQTEDRKQAFEDALKKLALIAAQQFAVEPPIPALNPRTGNWNAENKIIMRTHPLPRPATQFTPQINTYANPTAPPDTTLTLNSGTLSIGTSYIIILYIDGDDFTNVGGVNATGSIFTATGTTPTVWTFQSQLQART
jgi:hypothetical protein